MPAHSLPRYTTETRMSHMACVRTHMHAYVAVAGRPASQRARAVGASMGTCCFTTICEMVTMVQAVSSCLNVAVSHYAGCIIRAGTPS